MPAIQVARTDTFEQQRLKINELGSNLFNVTSGGSDLATGNLKMGDGSINAPSLAFDNDQTLGLYRPQTGVIAYVSQSKLLYELSDSGFLSFRNFVFRKTEINDSGIAIATTGQNYDPGTYNEISVIGGTGTSATLNITVGDFTGTEVSGTNYTPGTYFSLPIVGGNTATRSFVDFTVDNIVVNIVGGSGYTDGTYNGVAVTNVSSSGSSATADIIVSGGIAYSGTISGGSGYTDGNYTQGLRNQATQTFIVTVSGGPGSYAFVIDSVTQPALALEAANTYRFDVSDASNSGHNLFLQGAGQVGTPPAGLTLTNVGTSGTQGAYVDVIVENGYSLTSASYNCLAHTGAQMGADITFTTGTPGVYGSGAVADIVISGGALTALTFVSQGTDYKATDVLEIPPFTVGAGTGAEYLINGVTPNGSITSVTFTDSGQDYLLNDTLSVNAADVGGTGAGAEFTITTNPGKVSNFVFTAAATDYLANDVLTLATEQTGVAATLVGEDSGNTVPELSFTIADVSNIIPGSVITVTSGSGALGVGTTLVQGIDYDTNVVTIDNNPATSGAVVLTFTPPYGNPSTPFTYTVDSVGPIDSVTISNGGVGYFNGDILSVSGTDLVQPIVYPVTAIGLQELTFASNSVTTGTFTTSQTIKLRDGTPTATTTSSSTQLTANSVGPLAATLTTTVSQITLSSTAGISAGYIVTATGTGQLGANITVSSVDSGTQLTISSNPIASGAADLTFTEDLTQTYTGLATITNSGSGNSETVTVSRDALGNVSNAFPDQVGFFYAIGETLTIAGNLVGGATPADDITLTIDSVTDITATQVREVNESAGFITSIVVDEGNYFDNGIFVISGSTSPQYTSLTASATGGRFGYLIDVGAGQVFNPDISLFVGNTYKFDVSDASMSGHSFRFSEFPGGIHGNGFIDNVSSTLVAGSTSVTVSDSTGIVPGMLVTLDSGSATLQADTKVASVVDATTITFDKAPTIGGSVVIDFRGYAFEEGVSESPGEISIKILSTTPTLYYYSNNSDPAYASASGSPGNEASIAIDPNNPKTFGSGFALDVIAVGSIDIIKADITNGQLTTNSVNAVTGQYTDITASSNVNASVVNTTNVNATVFGTGTGLTISGGAIAINGPDINIGSSMSVENSTGNITTSGVIKSTQEFNSNTKLTIVDATIATLGSEDLLLQPAANRVAKTLGDTAFVIPSGNTATRPASPIAQDGAIRFNTQTNQYEGYSASSSSWSSLGGVRDLDGNTYILAEASIGANDNTLYFYNDGVNTAKVTPSYLDFFSVKKIRSSNTLAPLYVEWSANTVVAEGDYLKHKQNVYEVAVGGAGTTASTGNQPTHTTGTSANGTTQLTWVASSIDSLTFEEITEVKIGPTDSTSLVVNQKLRFSENTISTDTDDLILQPNSGQKTVISSTSSLVLPVGDVNQKGAAVQGSVRFNTTDSQFEGYDGAQWGSLGGVKDSDQDTLIKAETAPGSDEDTLFFFNANTETVRLSVNGLEFTGIDTINVSAAGVPGAETLAINADTITLDNNATTIDNTDSNVSFIFTSKQFLDLGVSSGLNNDPVIRLDDQGDVFLNTGFGTGVYNGVKIFDGDLKEFELSDYKIVTGDITFTKGTVDQGAIILYDPSIAIGCKVTVAALNTTTGDKELVEYTVIDNGTDISFTDFGNVKTGAEQFSSTFDFNASNNIRLNLTADSGLTTGDNIIISTTVNIYKR